ncbi:MAG: DMT family transporter [Rhodospirillaceae bacterium]
MPSDPPVRPDREDAKRPDTPFALILVAGVVFALIWSSAFSVAKILVASTPPFSVSALRFVIASGLAWAIALLLGQRLPRGRQAWRAIVILGLCQNTIYLGLFFTAMTRISAGLAVIIASALPLIVAFLASVFAGERVGAVKAGGLVVGFASVIWIMVTRSAGGFDTFGVVLAICGVLALSLATLTVKLVDFGTGLLMVVACQMLVGGIGCMPLALLFEDVTAFDWSSSVVIAFVYQVTFPGIVATLIWFKLVKLVTAAGASAFHFLNPIFGVVIAYLLLGEPVSMWDGVGVVLVAASILIVNLQRRA